jgi:endonuclease/exonuclease/phosphatase family metal-dependent hydrolase
MQWVTSHSWRNLIRNAVLFSNDWRLASVEVELFPKFGRMRRRGTTTAHLRRLGVRIVAVSTHFGLGPRERESHARHFTDRLVGMSDAIVIGVDLNEGPQASAARWVSDRLFDAFGSAGEGDGLTFPAKGPTARIDYLFVRNASVIRAWVSAAPNTTFASDHRAVAADLEVSEG